MPVRPFSARACGLGFCVLELLRVCLNRLILATLCLLERSLDFSLVGLESVEQCVEFRF